MLNFAQFKSFTSYYKIIDVTTTAILAFLRTAKTMIAISRRKLSHCQLNAFHSGTLKCIVGLKHCKQKLGPIFLFASEIQKMLVSLPNEKHHLAQIFF